MRRAALLRAHLDDAVVRRAAFDHHAAFADRQRERLLDVDVLAGLAGHDRRQRMPVIGRADDDGIDVVAVEHAAEVPRGELRRLVELLCDAVLRLRHLLVVDVAERDALRAESKHVAKVAGALAAAADQADSHAAVRAGHLVLRRGGYHGARGRRDDCSAGHARGRLLQE